MGRCSCDYRYLLLFAALPFIYIQMRLFSTQSEYADRLTDAIEAENQCTRQTRLLIDQISTQQGRIISLEEEKKRRDQECSQLKALVQDLQRKGVEKLVGDAQAPVAGVVVMACNRADYLDRTIKSILKYQIPVASKYPLFISQDGSDPHVKSKAMSYDQLTYMQHLDYEPVHTERPGEMIAYYKIARHYKWALDQLFYKHKLSRVIILEDDMEISPDFFDYFEAGAALMDRDKWGFWTPLISDLYLHYVQHQFLIKVVSNVTVADPSWQFLHGMTMDKNSLYTIHVSWAQYFVQASIFLLKYIW